MARSVEDFVRGSTVRFYDWLTDRKGSPVPQGPPIWICGDCHFGNLGPISSITGDIGIEIRDLDQGVIGEPAYDLIRLGLSLAMEARSSDHPGLATAHLLEAMIDGYVLGMADDPFADGGLKLPGPVRKALSCARGRNWAKLAKERIEDPKPTIPLGKRFWPLTSPEREAISKVFAEADTKDVVTALHGRHARASVRVLDAAYWVKGCSSLGRLRYAVLAGVGQCDAGDIALMDIKEAAPPVCPAREAGPDDDGRRVATAARKLSPSLGSRLVSATVLGRPVFIRELLPQDLKIELHGVSPGEVAKVGRYLAWIVGISHGRQLESADRAHWVKHLGQKKTRRLDAPSWLWTAVVDLIGRHEAAYLEHCRRCAEL